MPEDELARSLGLSTWISETEGIGGLLKVRVEDFRVEEVARTPALDHKGRFTVARITLTDWETNRFVSRLARELSISRKRIFFSGTKDKRAVTTQLFVIDAPVHKVEVVELKDVDIEVLGRSHQKLRLGDHERNRFTVVVRGCAYADGTPMSGEQAVEQVDSIIAALDARLGEARFPNWIGPQRFGSMRPVTAEVGRHVLEGDFQGAVDTYLGMPGLRESEEVALFRECWRKQQSVEAALEVIPRQLGFERDMLNHLKGRENDWRGAFRKLPNNLQLMTIHALQSLVFNHVLVERIERDMPLTSPLVGDLVELGDEGAHPLRHISQNLILQFFGGRLQSHHQVLLIHLPHQGLDLPVRQLGYVVEHEHQVAHRLGHLRVLTVHLVQHILLHA